jgi:hypothetical protein
MNNFNEINTGSGFEYDDGIYDPWERSLCDGNDLGDESNDDTQEGES